MGAYFESGRQLRAERNYSVSELECLAVVAAIKHFSFYLESKPFKVITDHRNLLYLDRIKDTKA